MALALRAGMGEVLPDEEDSGETESDEHRHVSFVMAMLRGRLVIRNAAENLRAIRVEKASLGTKDADTPRRIDYAF